MLWTGFNWVGKGWRCSWSVIQSKASPIKAVSGWLLYSKKATQLDGRWAGIPNQTAEFVTSTRHACRWEGSCSCFPASLFACMVPLWHLFEFHFPLLTVYHPLLQLPLRVFGGTSIMVLHNSESCNHVSLVNFATGLVWALCSRMSHSSLQLLLLVGLMPAWRISLFSRWNNSVSFSPVGTFPWGTRYRDCALLEKWNSFGALVLCHWDCAWRSCVVLFEWMLG
jgi:hypothetical protein